jgi:hypothetical protein
MQAALRTVFDAGAATFDPLVPMLFPLGALAVTMWFYKTGSRRLYWKIGAGVTVLLLVMAVVFPWIDYRRVHQKLAAGEVQTVEGTVSGYRRWTERRFDGTSKGVGVTTTHRYTKTTFETFYVGDRFFSHIVNGDPSAASFTNGGDPPVAIRDGMQARATYFADSWDDDRLRIVRLELGPGNGAPTANSAVVVPASGKSAGGGGASLPADFAAFRKRFGEAVGKGDAAATRTMVNFPFLFGGHTLEADEFDSLWMSLFSEPLRPCLATANAIAEGDRYTLFCGPYGYYFARTNAGWKLVEFGADGEAM